MLETNVTVEITAYQPQFKAAFKALNLEWITQYFVVEPEDVRVLEQPEENILNAGGAIFFAVVDGEAVGCCALLPEDDGKIFELIKMAVTPKAQGLKIGQKLCEYAIDFARQQGAGEIYLISNRKLHPALALYRKVGFVETELKAMDLALFQRCDIRMTIVF
jgi:putative acetyltransferase